MTDREILEAAAMAVGVVGKYVDDFGGGDYYYTGNICGILFERGAGGQDVWNPLESDADALRLAVDLGLDIVWPQIVGEPCGEVTAQGDDAWISVNASDTSGCKHAATRRAITLAAAQIGGKDND